jgi:hypothetical protein
VGKLLGFFGSQLGGCGFQGLFHSGCGLRGACVVVKRGGKRGGLQKNVTKIKFCNFFFIVITILLINWKLGCWESTNWHSENKKRYTKSTKMISIIFLL